MRPSLADRARLYRYLREMGYRTLDALHYAYGPPELPAVQRQREVFGL